MDTQTTTTTQQVAEALVSMCRNGQWQEVLEQYYSPNIVSREANPDAPVGQGIEAKIQKSQQWAENTEIHGMEISDAVVAGSHFSCAMKMDITDKQHKMRLTMEEICLYKVADGKIVEETFFYDM